MSAKQSKGFAVGQEAFDTVVIGGGQAGLAAGYFLAQRGANFIILDKEQRSGDTWRKRWDSLHLFTPSQFNGMPGKPFPQPDNYFPAKDEVAEFLEDYARQFNLPVRHGSQVTLLSRTGRNFSVSTGDSKFSARHVIIATGPYQLPKIPAFANELDPEIFQLHSSAYRNPQQIPASSLLVVGAGNSGAEIALELVKAGKQVWLAGPDVGRIPINSPLGKRFGGRPAWWIMSNVLSDKTPIGRKLKERALTHGAPLGRIRRPLVAQAGVELVPRLSGIRSGKPEIEGGQLLPVEGVLWATGFHPDYSWIDLPIFDEHGLPRHRRGVVQDAPGLYFLGLLFQSALISSLLGGVGRDAAYIVKQIGLNGQLA
jgi:putative flavoprotein involved in K+ transport